MKQVPLTASFFLMAELGWLTDAQIRAKLEECRACGFELLIPTLVAEHGLSMAPSRVLPPLKGSMFSYRARVTGQPMILPEGRDLFATLFAECERLSLGVFMPTGTLSPEKPGSHLMWPYPATEWFTPAMQERNARFIVELAERYGLYRSFHGWYISDEMKWSIDEHAFLVSAIATACRRAKPGVPIVMSPSPAHQSEQHRGLTDPRQVAKLDVDILSPMDSGGLCHKQTALSAEDFRTIERSHQQTAAACKAAGKRYWSNVELFTYADSHPASVRSAPADRVRQQLEIASRYAERLACFQYFSLVDAPQSKVPLGGEGATLLHSVIAARNGVVV